LKKFLLKRIRVVYENNLFEKEHKIYLIYQQNILEIVKT